MPHVTVVTMCHNYGRFLAECCESVQHQTYRDFEHIVIDAGSEDNTREVAQRFPVTMVELQDLGLCTSRNVGIKRYAQGEYVVNLDADDCLHAQALEKMVARAGKKTLVCPGLQEFEKGSNSGWPVWDFSADAFCESNRIFCCSMFNLEEFWAVGGYDPVLDWEGCEDWHLWGRMVRNGCSVVVIPEILFYYRVHAASSSARLQGRIAARHERVRKLLRELKPA